MIDEPVRIINKLGLHARAAAAFVKLASSFQSKIELTFCGQRVNGKSIMGIMMLAASQGSEMILHVDGADEQSAVDALVSLVNDRFGEDE